MSPRGGSASGPPGRRSAPTPQEVEARLVLEYQGRRSCVEQQPGPYPLVPRPVPAIALWPAGSASEGSVYFLQELTDVPLVVVDAQLLLDNPSDAQRGSRPGGESRAPCAVPGGTPGSVRLARARAGADGGRRGPRGRPPSPVRSSGRRSLRGRRGPQRCCADANLAPTPTPAASATPARYRRCCVRLSRLRLPENLTFLAAVSSDTFAGFVPAPASRTKLSMLGGPHGPDWKTGVAARLGPVRTK